MEKSNDLKRDEFIMKNKSHIKKAFEVLSIHISFELLHI